MTTAVTEAILQSERKFYVYVHRRVSDGRVFYVGKGKGYRHSTTAGRNKYWHRVAKKHGWFWEKPYENLTEACAHSIEKMLIYALRPQLTNVTDGGEGVSGLRHTEETKRKMVANRGSFTPWLKGKKMPEAMRAKLRLAKLGTHQSPEHAQKSRTNKIGKRQPRDAVERTRRARSKKIINSDGEIFPSATDAARQLSARLGKYVSQGNISLSAQFNRNNAYGLTWSYDTSKIPEFRPTLYRDKTVLCVEQGEVFGSAQAATEWVREWRGSANNQCITQAARSGGTAYGYHWRYIADDEQLPDNLKHDSKVEKLRKFAA
ncbi:MAG: hypothetical protein E6R03_15705 [Hyphomicrobiaceae bacterium]|nr:MAG: hypothetical protein E6R03_15705 [Hyphomicrobiaceae bacterium]